MYDSHLDTFEGKKLKAFRIIIYESGTICLWLKVFANRYPKSAQGA